MGELINVLATVARTVDALEYLATTVGGHVLKCNPSTSDDGHDIEALADGRHILVEVSDVAGSGNANGKMTKDLATLLGSSSEAQLLLAVSESSGRWLTEGKSSIPDRYGAKCRLMARIPASRDLQTWIISVDRTPSTTPHGGPT